MPLSGKLYTGIIDAISSAKRITICAHVRPDGDAVGSVLALSLMLSRIGKPNTKVCAAIDVKEVGLSSFLCDDWPKDECTLAAPSQAVALPCDLLVCLDTASVDRIPEPLRNLVGKVPTLVIDHHVTNPCYGTVNWVASAPATGELVTTLAKRAKWPMDQRVAEALWVAIITDSGRFAYDQTTPSTMRCAATLLEHGVRSAWINDRIYVQSNPNVIELRKRAMNSLEIWPNGIVASVTITARDFNETNSKKSDSEDIVDIPRMPCGNKIALFFYEVPGTEGTTRVSIRTRPPFDATWLACRHGGGGHIRAAGCDFPCPISSARSAIESEIDEWIRATPAINQSR